MKIRNYGLILSALLLVLGSILGYVQVKDPQVDLPLLTRTNYLIYDSFFKSKTSNKALLNKSESILIAIDDESVQELGRWPWSREVIDQITKNALASGIKTIGFDIIFSESGDEKIDSDFANTILKNKSKVVLGIFGNQKLDKVAPYQDYCYTEAFLHTGGGSILNIENGSIYVEDDNIQFEELRFESGLKKIFLAKEADAELFYLKKVNIKSKEQLNKYQSNYLQNIKIAEVYEYCRNWLTDEDDNIKTLKNYYSDKLNEITGYENLDFESKISKFKSDVENLAIVHYGEWIPNTPIIQNSSLYTASFIADLDTDGIIRKYPLLYRIGNKLGSSYIPSLALQTYLASTGYQAEFKLMPMNKTKVVGYVKIKDISKEKERTIYEIPVDQQGRTTVNYYGNIKSLPYVSARDLYHNEDKLLIKTNSQEIYVDRKDFLKEKTAIFGATANAIFDLRNTPVNVAFPGPEIHLTVMENLFKQNFMKTSTYDFQIYFFALLLIISLLSLTFLYSNLLAASGLFVVINVVIYFLAEYYFKQNIQFTLLSTLFLNTAITYFLYLVYIYFFETRKSQEIKNTFSKYVSKEIVNEILKNQDNLQLKGQKLNMTVFFSDIRSFTDFSEKMDPQELSLLLNKYLTPMSETIFGTQGTIDKFMGDAIMALFGAPINYPDHPQKACKAALKCLSHLDKLNTDFAKRGWPEIKIGIGLNTGYMVAGNIGSDQIQSYTVIGDEVNLASRLEGLTKNYNAKILISETTYNAVKNEYVAQEADLVRVKGKTKPVRIYILLDEKDHFKDFSFLEKYHAALKLFQDKNFAEAHSAFKKLLIEKPSDNFLCELYLKRSSELINDPPPSNWDGVFEYKTK